MKVLPFFISTGNRDAEQVSAWTCLLCPNYKLLPWQVERDALSSTGFTELSLFDCDGAYTDIMSEVEMSVVEKTSSDYITYNGEPLDTHIDNGVYYIRAFDGNSYYRSEWFEVRDIQSSVLTGWTATGFSTFTVSTGGSRIGVDILSAISAATGTVKSNTFAVKKKERLILTSDLSTTTMGVSCRVQDSTDTIISNTVTLSGISTGEIIITKYDAAAYLYITQGAGTTSIGRFSLRRKAGDFILMEYTNTNDIQGASSILYASGFAQELYLDTVMNNPQHEIIETGEEKNGVFQAEKIVDKLLYNIIAYGSRSLVKALRILPMHDDIEITDDIGNIYTPSVGNLRVTWEETTFDTYTIRVEFNEEGDVWTSNMDDIT